MESVPVGLLSIQARFHKIKAISTDSGSQFIKAHLQPQLINKEAPEIMRLFEDVTWYTAAPDSQFRNYCTRLIQEFKMLVRSSYEIPRNCPLPFSTIFMLQVLFEYIINLLTDIPFALDQEANLLCPNSFLKTTLLSIEGPPLL